MFGKKCISEVRLAGVSCARRLHCKVDYLAPAKVFASTHTGSVDDEGFGTFFYEQQGYLVDQEIRKVFILGSGLFPGRRST